MEYTVLYDKSWDGDPIWNDNGWYPDGQAWSVPLDPIFKEDAQVLEHARAHGMKIVPCMTIDADSIINEAVSSSKAYGDDEEEAAASAAFEAIRLLVKHMGWSFYTSSGMIVVPLEK